MMFTKQDLILCSIVLIAICTIYPVSAAQFNILNITMQISNATHTDMTGVLIGNGSHITLLNSTYDPISQYAYLPGRAGGQTIFGGTSTTDDLILNSTNNNAKASDSAVGLQLWGGRVGINTTHPNSQFTILSNTNRQSYYGVPSMSIYDMQGSPVLALQGATTDGIQELDFMSGGNPRWQITSRADSTNYRMSFVDNSGSQRLVLTQSGNVGVGTTSPTAQFQTTGTMRFQGFGAGTLTTDAGGNVSVVSDEKAKTNIKPYTVSAIDKIQKVNPIIYRYSPDSGLDTNHDYVGFSAQNLRVAIPEAVSARDDTKFITEKEMTIEVKTGTQTLSVSDRAIIATLVNGMKEQQVQIEAQQKQLDALEARLSMDGIK